MQAAGARASNHGTTRARWGKKAGARCSGYVGVAQHALALRAPAHAACGASRPSPSRERAERLREECMARGKPLRRSGAEAPPLDDSASRCRAAAEPRNSGGGARTGCARGLSDVVSSQGATRLAQLHTRRRRAGVARGRAGWSAAVRVRACGKRANRAVSGGKRVNGSSARRAARQQQRSGRRAGAWSRASKRERRAGDARARTGSSSAVRASSCGKRAGAGLGWAGSGACSSGGGSEGGDFSAVAIGRRKGGERGKRARKGVRGRRRAPGAFQWFEGLVEGWLGSKARG